MTLERPEPVIFNATLEDVRSKRSKMGLPPEITLKLTANIAPGDVRHVMKMQEMYMQVALAPAQAFMPLGTSDNGDLDIPDSQDEPGS